VEYGKREVRRILGYGKAALAKLALGGLRDPRKRHQPDRGLDTVVGTVILGMAGGEKSLAQVEAATCTWSAALKRKLGFQGRMPDTSMRDVLVKLDLDDVRGLMHRQIKAAHRSKSLQKDGMPVGMCSVDGKGTALDGDNADHPFAQRQEGTHRVVSLVRTFTCTLASSRAAPILDMIPIPAETNEVGHFATAVSMLEEAYGHLGLYELVAGDCGQTSLANANHVRQLRGGKLHYLLQLGGNQPSLWLEADRLFSIEPNPSRHEATVLEGDEVVTRTIEIVDAGPNGVLEWTHARAFIRVTRVAQKKTDGTTTRGQRTYVSSYSPDRFTPAEWLHIVVRRWDVENRSHGVLDRVFAEDHRHWIETPHGFLVCAALRRVALTLVGIFRSVTLRAEASHERPWRDYFRWLGHALAIADGEILAGLRPRSETPAASV